MTIEKLQKLKLMGFIDSLNEIISNTTIDLSLVEAIDHMTDRELLERKNRKQRRLLKSAKLRYPNALISEIDYKQKRSFNATQFRELTHCEWVSKFRNVILSGPTGVGKSYLACALGNQACQQMYSVKYYRVARLINALALSHADGSYTKILEQLSKVSLLILDDWGIDQLDRQARRDLLEVLEDRSERLSTIITTQLPITQWHQFIGDDTIADAICDRVINNSYQIEITGESMRGVKNLTAVEHLVVS